VNILLDTNILFHLSKSDSFLLLTQSINPDNKKIYVSITSIGEIKSLAVKNNWGLKRRNILNEVLEQINVIEINESLTDIYAEIDAFSQRRNPSYTTYPFSTPRNMGKNDLWIAATATLLSLKLITTDADFEHLHGAFLEVQFIKADLL
jgi:tRNA(fMet)-specific endonuclease VapC